MGFGVNQQFESNLVQRVSGKHRNRLIEGLVHCRFAAPHVVIVHARQVVVNQRIDVNGLDRTADAQRRGGVDIEQPARGDCQQRAHPLAAADRGMAHRLVKRGACIVRYRQKLVEQVVDVARDIRQRLGQNRRHLAHRGRQLPSNGAVPVGDPSLPRTIRSIFSCADFSRASHCRRSFAPSS